jgi:homoserine O-acetyltransferase
MRNRLLFLIAALCLVSNLRAAPDLPPITQGDFVITDLHFRDGQVLPTLTLHLGSNPLLRYQQAPTSEKAEEVLNKYGDTAMKTMDAGDVLYAVQSSRDYDPAPKLEEIRVPLVASNSADDLIKPPDLGILEKQIKRVKNGRTILIPEGPETQGHRTHTLAKVWKDHLAELLKANRK